MHRVPQAVRIKARCAGNGGSLAKRRNEEPCRLWVSLWARRWTAIRCVAPPCNSSLLPRRRALRTDRPAPCCVWLYLCCC